MDDSVCNVCQPVWYAELDGWPNDVELRYALAANDVVVVVAAVDIEVA